MLEEGFAPADLRGPDDLATLDQNLAADCDGETGGATARWSDGLTVGQRGIDAHGPQRPGESSVDFAVRVTERAKQCDRCGDRVGRFVLVPHGLPACRSTDYRDARDDGRLIATDRECWGIPAIESKECAASAY